jgi:hypothetical protein
VSATDELRRLLDERGVEWGNIRNDGSESDYLTEWQFDGIEGHAIATEWAVGQHLTVCITHPMTPEQAIAATLGSCSCSNNCTNGERTGTCRDEGDPSDFCCSECGVRMFIETSDTYTMIASDERTIIKHPNYCPNCGRKVVTDG